MTELLKIRKGDVDEGSIKVNTETLGRLGLSDGDLCKVVFPITMKTALVSITSGDDVASGDFISAEGLPFHFGIEEGFDCELDSYDRGLKDIDNVILKVDSLGDKDVDVNTYITGQKDALIQRMMGRYINNNSKIPFYDLGIYVEVESVYPKLSSEEYGFFNESIDVQLSKKYKNYFNGILLLDCSKSMSSKNEEDMMMPLVNDAFLENISSNKEVKDYISNKIHEKERITKLDAAILAIMAFLSAKVSRGRGEEISIVLWSEVAISLNFVVDGKKRSWISTGEIGEKDTMAEVIASELLNEAYRIQSKQTNMEKAIIRAREIRDGIVNEQKAKGEAHPTMIIFLTDGKRTAGRSPIGMVKDEIANLDKTVLHTIGLGDDVEEQELIDMANLCSGKYFNTRDVKELIEFYDEEASKFTITKIQKNQEKNVDMKKVFEKLNRLRS